MQQASSKFKGVNTVLLTCIVGILSVMAMLKFSNMVVLTVLAAFVAILFFVNIPFTVRKFSALTYILLLCFLVHFFTTAARATTLVVFILTVLLYETTKNASFSVKPLIILSGIFLTVNYFWLFNDMLASILGEHSSRADLYKGFFLNANTNAAFYVFTFFLFILFGKNKKVNWVVTFFVLTSIWATGSRGALLCLILFAFFTFMIRKGREKLTFWLFIGILVAAFLYLFVFEINSTADFTFMGKEANSAGRSEQIASTILHFPINLFGNGKDAVEDYSMRLFDFSVHNFYVSSLYSLGIIIFVCYFIFVLGIYKELLSKEAKAAWIALNVYFFFEPGICYYLVFLNSYPTILILLKLSEERHELKLST